MASPIDTEPEILAGKRAFPKAQELLSGGAVGATRKLEVGWHDTTVSPLAGAFAVVDASEEQDGLIGEIVRVSYAGRQAFVYVVASATLPDGTQFSLARRAFCAIGRLSLGVVSAEVVVVE